jgi:hypothetical protein
MENLKLGFEECREDVLKKIKKSKIVEVVNNSGFSYFMGKERMLKILKNKKSVSLEINVILDSEIEKKYNLELFSKEYCKLRHMGSMKYFKSFKIFNNEVKILIDEIIKNFNK